MTKIKQFEEKAKRKAQEQAEEVKFEKVEPNSSVLDSPEVIFDKTEEFFKKNQKWITISLIALIVALGGYFGFKYYQDEQQKEAAAKLFPAEYFLRMDSLNQVLKGAGKYASAKKIAEEYSITKAGKLARLYSGIALMKEGKFKEAIAQLEQFSSDDKLIQGRAYCLLGDAYMELNQLDNATQYYRKAANYYRNQYYTPIYLNKLALAYELKGDNKMAINTYNEIIEEYYNSQERANAQKYKARLEAMMAK
ncbi:MAG: hypothetical protein OHK0045_08750 [Raineya sp.]